MTQQTLSTTGPQPDYRLTADGLTAFSILIRMQNSVTGLPTQARLLDFMSGLTSAC